MAQKTLGNMAHKIVGNMVHKMVRDVESKAHCATKDADEYFTACVPCQK